MRATTQVLVDRHIQAYLNGDVDGLMADYAPDCTFITKATGAIKGVAAIRDAFDMVFKEIFPPATTSLIFEPALILGEIALLHWSAATPSFRTVGAFDSFVIREGKIVAQTGGGEFLPVEAD